MSSREIPAVRGVQSVPTPHGGYPPRTVRCPTGMGSDHVYPAVMMAGRGRNATARRLIHRYENNGPCPRWRGDSSSGLGGSAWLGARPVWMVGDHLTRVPVETGDVRAHVSCIPWVGCGSVLASVDLRNC